MGREQDSGIGLVWFAAGIAIGAGVALLYAPQSGSKTRALLGKKTEEGRDALAGTGREVYEKGREIYDRGREIADEAADLFEKGRKLARG